MNQFNDFKKERTAKEIIIEMKKDASGQWVMDEEKSLEMEKRLPMNQEKRKAIFKMLEWFSYDPVVACDNFIKLRKKYVDEKVITEEEINAIVKPYAIKNTRRIWDRWDSFGIFIDARDRWLKEGVIDESDIEKLNHSEDIRGRTFREVEDVIEKVWKHKKHNGLFNPNHFSSKLFIYIMSGIVTSEEVEQIWEKHKEKVNG